MYNYTLFGDHNSGLPTYEASNHTDSYIDYQIRVEETDGTVYTFPPSSIAYIYPAWPPSQINATSQVEPMEMFPGETFWVNGTAHYWNSTTYPNDYAYLINASNCFVNISVNPIYEDKTDAFGNYSFELTAPAMPGFYHRPRSVADLVDFVVGKVLSRLGIEHDLDVRWPGCQDR